MAEEKGVMAPAERRPITVDQLLREARSELTRLSPSDADRRCRDGAVLIDIRSEGQISRDGEIPGAVFISRNVLEWRLDPNCPDRIPQLAGRERLLVLICNQGYQSSLAAANLRRFGVDATDVVGGFQAWRQAGLPIEPAAEAGAAPPEA
jgi:rhodanese-related sulfurtransferase